MAWPEPRSSFDRSLWRPREPSGFGRHDIRVVCAKLTCHPRPADGHRLESARQRAANGTTRSDSRRIRVPRLCSVWCRLVRFSCVQGGSERRRLVGQGGSTPRGSRRVRQLRRQVPRTMRSLALRSKSLETFSGGKSNDWCQPPTARSAVHRLVSSSQSVDHATNDGDVPALQANSMSECAQSTSRRVLSCPQRRRQFPQLVMRFRIQTGTNSA
jgi:hypothetical protein